MHVLVVDDHPIIADSLALALTRDREASIDKAEDLEAGLALAARTRYDLVMLDLGLPGCSGVQALERFRTEFPEHPVVVFSGDSHPASISAALELGAMGYIPKTSRNDVILGAIRLVVSGGIYVPVEALKRGGMETPAPPAPARTEPRPEDLGLSPRQSEVLSLLLKGLPNKLIARRLDISENTTKIHVSAVFQRLGVQSRTQALIAANRLGLRLDVQ